MRDERTEATSHGQYVETSDEFTRKRQGWRTSLAADEGLRESAVQLQVAADEHHYGYQWEWAGVPIIRLADDIMLAQELFWSYRPQRVIETGVARGGSMILDASLMSLAGEEPAVLGIDICIYAHTHTALNAHPLARGITLLEADSTSTTASQHAEAFLDACDRAVVILDSNHTHDHVLAELRALAPLLPVGGFVLVADTLVEEFPDGHYANRPWGPGNNPMTAVRQFLAEDKRFALANDWARRALVSEFRDGILQRVS